MNAPGALPINHHEYRADKIHFTKGRGRFRLPSIIVVHSTVGKDSRDYLSTTSLPPNNVSAHALVQGVDRYNLVDLNNTAYHAGCCIPGVSNSNSLGLEIENYSGHVMSNGMIVSEEYSADTQNTAAHCVAAWMFSYGIPLFNVRRHADVAVYCDDYEVVWMRGKLGRKHDPVGLDWHAFMARVQAWYDFFKQLDPSEHYRWII